MLNTLSSFTWHGCLVVVTLFFRCRYIFQNESYHSPCLRKQNWSMNSSGVYMASSNPLSRIQHIVVLMLENRSFDSMLGFLYAEQENKSPSGQPFEGLTGKEANLDSTGKSIPVFKIKPTDKNAYFKIGR